MAITSRRDIEESERVDEYNTGPRSTAGWGKRFDTDELLETIVSNSKKYNIIAEITD